MHIITTHKSNECNEAIELSADERDDQNGGASHAYKVVIECKDGVAEEQVIEFQRGPIKEVGTNGLTHEVLLAILIDRLAGFQLGAFACSENGDALAHLEMALQSMHDRTYKRVARGVEGTLEV